MSQPASHTGRNRAPVDRTSDLSKSALEISGVFRDFLELNKKGVPTEQYACIFLQKVHFLQKEHIFKRLNLTIVEVSGICSVVQTAYKTPKELKKIKNEPLERGLFRT